MSIGFELVTESCSTSAGCVPFRKGDLLNSDRWEERVEISISVYVGADPAEGAFEKDGQTLVDWAPEPPGGRSETADNRRRAASR